MEDNLKRALRDLDTGRVAWWKSSDIILVPDNSGEASDWIRISEFGFSDDELAEFISVTHRSFIDRLDSDIEELRRLERRIPKWIRPIQHRIESIQERTEGYRQTIEAARSLSDDFQTIHEARDHLPDGVQKVAGTEPSSLNPEFDADLDRFPVYVVKNDVFGREVYVYANHSPMRIAAVGRLERQKATVQQRSLCQTILRQVCKLS